MFIKWVCFCGLLVFTFLFIGLHSIKDVDN